MALEDLFGPEGDGPPASDFIDAPETGAANLARVAREAAARATGGDVASHLALGYGIAVLADAIEELAPMVETVAKMAAIVDRLTHQPRTTDSMAEELLRRMDAMERANTYAKAIGGDAFMLDFRGRIERLEARAEYAASSIRGLADRVDELQREREATASTIAAMAEKLDRRG